VSRDVRTPVTTSDFITRMTPREQPRMTREDSPTWIEYQRRHADELDEGRRALEKIASGAACVSDEPYIHTGPRSLLVGRHEQHAVRLGPQTRKCDNASRAGTSHGVIGQMFKVAGQRSDEFHIVYQWGPRGPLCHTRPLRQRTVLHFFNKFLQPRDFGQAARLAETA